MGNKSICLLAEAEIEAAPPTKATIYAVSMVTKSKGRFSGADLIESDASCSASVPRSRVVYCQGCLVPRVFMDELEGSILGGIDHLRCFLVLG